MRAHEYMDHLRHIPIWSAPLRAGLLNSPIPEEHMPKTPNEKKRKCKNCEGKGTLKKSDKVVRCQRCHGTGIAQR